MRARTNENVMRLVLIVVMLLVCMTSVSAQGLRNGNDAPSVVSPTIPSEATGGYAGQGWACDITAALRAASRPSPLSPLHLPAVEWDCSAPNGRRYVGYVMQQYAGECPRSGSWGYLLDFAPPWLGPSGTLELRGYDPANPALLVLSVTIYPSAPQIVTLTRTSAGTSPAPYSCNNRSEKR